MRDETFAKLAYNAYCKSTGGRSAVTGDLLPAYELLPEHIRDAWYAASFAVIEAVR